MDEINFDGVRYVSASHAAKYAALTRDYIARLCKEGRIAGKRVGSYWYVNLDSLQFFLSEKEKSQKTRQKELLDVRRKEYRTGKIQTRKVQLGKISSKADAINLQTKIAHVAARQAYKFPSEAIQVLSSAAAHIPAKATVSAHTLSPLSDALHRIIAATFALLLTVGTYALVDRDFAQAGMQTLRTAYNSVQEIDAGEFAVRAGTQIAAVADNPSSALDSLIAFTQNTFHSFFASVTSYATALRSEFSEPGTSFSTSDLRGSVRAQVVSIPGGVPEGISPSTTFASTSSGPTYITTNPIVERVVETERLVISGGITEEVLNARITALNNDLTNRMLSLTSANSTVINNTYQTLGAIARGDNFDDINITDSDITDSRISGGTVAGLTSPLEIGSGGTGTSTSPAYGQVLLGQTDGTYALVATSSLGITGGGGGSIDGSGAANLFAYWTDSDTLAATSSPTVGYLTATSSATSTFTTLSLLGRLYDSVGTSGVNGYVLQTTGTGISWVATSSLGITGGSSFAYPFPSDATSTLLTFTGGILVNAATSTITNLTIVNASSTNATTTRFAITGLTSTLLKTQADGSVVAAVAGTDYLTTVGFGKTFEQTTNIFSQTSLKATSTATHNLVIDATGTSTFAGGLEAWRQIAAPYFHATSSTATSTFSGGVLLATSGGNVGIATSTPTERLTVNGDILISRTDSTTAGLRFTGSDGRTFRFVNYGTTGISGTGGIVSSVNGPYSAPRFAAFNANQTTTYFSLYDEGTADVMSLRNTTNAQRFNIYNTYTSASVYERAGLYWSDNVFSIDAEAAGGGTQRNLSLNSRGGYVGVGTTSPFAKFSIHADTDDTYSRTLFVVASSTASATTTIFTIGVDGATTTNLAITGITSTLLKTNTDGSVIAAIAGTDYANFAYLFPAGATSTLLSFTGGIVVNAASTTITNLVTVNASSTNATTSNFAITNLTSALLTTNALGTVVATTSLVAMYGGTGQTSYSVGDVLYASAAGTLTRLGIGGVGDVLKVSGGVPTWGTDNAGGGGAGGTWSTTTSQVAGTLINYPNNASDVVVIGATATTSAEYWFDPNITTAYLTGKVGIGTTSPYAQLSVVGQTVSAYFTATTSQSSTFPYASSTAITISGTASTSALIVSNTVTLPAASISNTMLANSSVSYGGVALSLGGSDATPAFDLTDAINLPISTGVSGLGSNVATWLGTPSSANFASAVTGETGTGAVVFGTQPTITDGRFSSTTLETNTLITGNATSSGTFALTTITSSLLKTNSQGQFTAAIAGTDYANFAYLFPAGATSTLLSFTGGIVVNAASTTITNLVTVNSSSTNATTSNFAITNLANSLLATNGTGVVFSTTTIGLNLIPDNFLRNDANDTTSGAITSTANSANTFPYASTTAFSAVNASSTFADLFRITNSYASSTAITISGTASSTSLNVSGLNAANCDVKASTAGILSCGTDADSGGDITAVNAGTGLSGGAVAGSATLSLDLTNANTWTALQQFSAGASTTQLSALDAIYVGRTATTTIRGDNQASTLPYASTTALTATTASTTNLIVSSAGGTGTRCLQVGADGTVSANASACGSGSSFGQAFEITTNTFAQASLKATSTATHNLVIDATGTSTFAGGLEAWRQIAAPYFHATSTTATSTFSGGLTTGATGLNVSTNGNVGIGTAAPSRIVDISGSATPYLAFTPTATHSQWVIGSEGSGFVVYDDTNNQYRAAFSKTANAGLSIGTTFYSTAAPANGAIIQGNVGIGTSTPDSLFQVGNFDTRATTTFASPNAVSYGSALAFLENTSPSGFSLYHDTNSNYLRLDGISSGVHSPGIINFERDQRKIGVSSSTPWARFSVHTQDLAADVPSFVVGSSTRTDLVVLQSGNVGIGTSTPFTDAGSKLDVSGNGLTSLTVTDVTDSVIGQINVASTGVWFQSYTNNPLNLAVNNDIARFTIATSGRIGIGTTSPASLLSVHGSGYISSNLFVGGTITSTSSAASTFPFASTTAITATTASTTDLLISSIASGSLLKTTTAGSVIAAVAGTDYANFAYLFPAGATSSLVSFTGGIISNASSTIGAGGQTTGLTISGGATTTGNFIVSGTGTSSFAGILSVGSTTPFANPLFSVGTSSPTLYVDNIKGYIGLNTSAPSSGLTVNVRTSDTAAATFAKLQSANDTGLYLSFTGASGADRGYFGYTKHGSGNNTFFTGETADAIAIRSEGAFQLGTGGDNIRMTILSTGNTGFGTTSPYARLSVVGQAVAAYFTATTSQASTFPYASTTAITVSGTASTSKFFADGLATCQSENMLTWNGGTFGCESDTATAGADPFTFSTNFAQISAATTSPIWAKAGVFASSTSYIASTTFAINGNVGIGTTSPQRILHLSTIGQSTGAVPRLEAGTGFDTKFEFWIDGVEKWEFGNDSSEDNSFVIADGDVSTNARLVVKQGGNVGIGTTTPQWLLNLTSASAAQLSLSAGAGTAQWAFRNAGGNLYLATTTVAGTATTSSSAFSILSSNGAVGIGTSSPIHSLSITSAPFFDWGGIGLYSGALTSGGYIDFFSNSGTKQGGFVFNDTNNTNGTGLIFKSYESTVPISFGYEPSGGSLTRILNVIPSSLSVGVGTTSPYARLSVHAGSTDTYKNTLFAIASSTASATTTHLVVTAGGNVGIGTTSPNTLLSVGFGATGGENGLRIAGQYPELQLDSTDTTVREWRIIVGSGAAADKGKLRISDRTGGIEVMTFDLSGNVGIGTTSPGRLLSLEGTSNPGIQLYNTGAGANQWLLYARTSATGNSFAIFDDTANQDRFGIDTSGNVSIGTSSPWGLLSVNPNGISGPAFAVGSSTKTDFVVTNGGRVGVGTSSPTRLLTLAYDNANISTSHLQIDQAGAGDAWQQFSIDSAAGGSYGIGMVGTGQSGSGNFQISYNASAMSALTTNARLSINTSGNVGIGTTTPQWLLNPFSSSAAQLALSAGAGVSQWAFRNAGGNLYISTTTVDGTATSTLYAIIVATTSRVSFASSFVVGNYFGAAFNSIGNPGSSDDTNINAANDLYIEDSLEVDGTMYLTGGSGAIVNSDVAEVLLTERGRNYILCNADPSCVVSEEFVKDELDFGDLVCINEDAPQTITRCTEANSHLAIGFVSETATLKMGNSEKVGYPIAVAGIALAHVTNENGDVNPGDMLVSAGRDGYAMKSGSFPGGVMIGKAYDFCHEETCKIPVFVLLDGVGTDDVFESIATSTEPAPGSYAERFFNSLFARMTHWLANAQNGIGDVLARAFSASEKICVDGECLTANDIRALKSALVAAGAGATETPPPAEESSAAPVIVIMGENPEHVLVGESYTDLGALVSDDNDNPGIITLVDGEPVLTVNLDTSAPRTYEITYRAEDSDGNVTEATRIVTVEESLPTTEDELISDEPPPESDPDPESELEI